MFLFYGVFLAAALVFGGCQAETITCPLDGINPDLQGTWTDGYGGSYTISTTLRYDSGYGGSFEGDIVSAVNFSGAAGVLVVELTSVTNTDGDWGTNYTVGKYTGVYYKDLTSSHVLLANSYPFVQVDDLDTALSTFTPGNVDTHISFWGSGYGK